MSQMNQQLQDFYTHLNEAVTTTNDFAEGTRFRKRAKVSQFAYCGLNCSFRTQRSFLLPSLLLKYTRPSISPLRGPAY
jgi:hypothetical protein